MIDYRPNPYGYGCMTGSADDIHAAGMLTINKHSYDGVKLLEADGLRIMRGSKFGMRAKIKQWSEALHPSMRPATTRQEVLFIGLSAV